MRNLGPKSRSWLNEAGINNIEDLKRFGRIPAFLAVRQLGHPVSFNLLWAIAAAIEDRDWRDLSAQEKTLLKKNWMTLGNNGHPQGKTEFNLAPVKKPPRRGYPKASVLIAIC